jgi:hypothetical protein
VRSNAERFSDETKLSACLSKNEALLVQGYGPETISYLLVYIDGYGFIVHVMISMKHLCVFRYACIVFFPKQIYL